MNTIFRHSAANTASVNRRKNCACPVFRSRRIFQCVTLLLLLVFGIAQIHELIPFLHEDASELLPREYCPFCIIKGLLTLALVFLAFSLPPHSPPQKASLFSGVSRDVLIVGSIPARGPPLSCTLNLIGTDSRSIHPQEFMG